MVVGCSLVHSWFTRDTLAAYAPENTAYAITVLPTKTTWPKIQENFSHQQLIGGVPLKQLAPYLKQRLSIFIQEDGARTIVFHGQLPESLRRELLSCGLNISEPKRNITLISYSFEQEQSGLKQTTSLWSRFNPGYLGSIILPKQETVLPVLVSDSSLSIKLGQNKGAQTLPLKLPENTLLALEFPPEIGVFPDWIPENLSSHLSSGAELIIYLNNDQNHTLELTLNKDIGSAELKELHNQLLSAITPMIETKTLHDGSRVNELRLNHDQIIEEATLGPLTTLRSNWLTSSTNETETSIILSWSKEFQETPETTEIPTTCLINPVGLTLTNGLAALLSNNIHREQSIFDILSNFVYVGLDKQGNNLYFKACF